MGGVDGQLRHELIYLVSVDKCLYCHEMDSIGSAIFLIYVARIRRRLPLHIDTDLLYQYELVPVLNYNSFFPVPFPSIAGASLFVQYEDRNEAAGSRSPPVTLMTRIANIAAAIFPASELGDLSP